MNTKCNMCLAAIAIAISVGVVATLVPIRSVISQIYQYKKVDISYLYSYPPGQEPPFEKNGIMNGQILWEKEEKIEIKGYLSSGGTVFRYDAFTITGVEDKDPRAARIQRNTNYYEVYLSYHNLSRINAQKLINAKYNCVNLVDDKVYYTKGTYIIVRGSIYGNFPYKIKDENGRVTSLNDTFTIEADDIETCLTKDDYNRR